MMKIFNKVIFTICFLISCFIFSDKVFAGTSGFRIPSIQKVAISDEEVVSSQGPNPYCLEGADNQWIGTVESPGMSLCSFNYINPKLQPTWGDSSDDDKANPTKHNGIYYPSIKQSSDKTIIYTYYKTTSYTISRVDAFFNCDKNNENCYWDKNENVGNLNIYPGMNLVYEVKDQIKDETSEGIYLLDVIVTKASVEKYIETTKNMIEAFQPNFELYKNKDENLGWVSVATMNSDGTYTKYDPATYGQYQYTTDINSLVASRNPNNNNTVLGYNGTMYNYLYKQEKGNKQWDFHYLIPIKTEVYKVKVEENKDPCIKNKEDMTPQERAKCFKCETYRTDKDKDSYVKEGCCTGTDSANASSEWCCKDDTYFNNNKTKCCSSEKSTSYKGL